LTIADLKDGTAAACTLPERGSAALPDGGPMRFLVEVDRGLVAGLVQLGFIRPDEREELGTIIAGMKHLGWAPYVSRLA
jgi:hypothetical protein